MIVTVFPLIQMELSKLVVPFALIGELRIVQEQPIRPSTAGQRLYLKESKSNRMILIDSLADLKFRVKISNCAGALAFVRLRTSPATARFFQSPLTSVEPLDRDTMGKVAFGIEGEHKWVTLRSVGEWGLVNGETRRKLRIPRATCRMFKDTFIIERPLINLRAQRLQRVEERVTRQGEYISKLIGRPWATEGLFYIHVEE